jgi:hypothetical protein
MILSCFRDPAVRRADARASDLYCRLAARRSARMSIPAISSSIPAARARRAAAGIPVRPIAMRRPEASLPRPDGPFIALKPSPTTRGRRRCHGGAPQSFSGTKGSNPAAPAESHAAKLQTASTREKGRKTAFKYRSKFRDSELAGMNEIRERRQQVTASKANKGQQGMTR